MRDHFENKYIDLINDDIYENYFTPVLDDVFAYYKPKYVCDIGCGNGVFTSSIKHKFDCKLFGVDGNKYALKQASKLDFDNLSLVKDFSIDSLPFNDGTFDLVICKDVLEHLVDPVHLVNEIHRITSNNGIFLFHVPNHFPIWGRIKFLFTNNIDTFNYFPESERYNFPHIRFFNMNSVKKLLGNSGFIMKKNLSHHFAKPRIIHRFIPSAVKKLLAKFSTDNFSEGITLIFEKRL